MSSSCCEKTGLCGFEQQIPFSCQEGPGAPLAAQMVESLPAVQETWVESMDRKDLQRKEWLPTPVFLPGEAHGQRNPVGYSPRGRKELDAPECLTQCWKPGGPQSRCWQMVLPWWSSGRDFTFQCRGHRLDPWAES